MNPTPFIDDPVVAAAFAREPFDVDAADVAAASAFRPPLRRPPVARRSLLRPLLGVAAAGVLAASVAAAPLRTLASNFLEIFEPQRIAPIALTQRDREALRMLPQLQAYGTVRELVRPARADAVDAAAAQRLAGFAVAVPRSLPTSVPSGARYQVIGRGVSAFTFSAARAAATAAKSGAALPPMPARLDGSTIEASVGPIVIATYGAASGASARGGVAVNRALPPLGIVQMPRPQIASDGASAAAIENYLLSMPGVPSDLHRQIAALRDPATTLPLPIDVDRQYAQPIAIGANTSGLVIGDNTGLGAAVIWQRGAMVYAAFGSLPARQLAALAATMP